MRASSLLTTLMLLAAPFAFAEEPVRPNVIIFLADDMGWTGPACYGGDLHETPNIDRLAEEGVRFTDAYAACTVCSPTRASVLTGKYPARLHVTNWIKGFNPKDRMFVAPDWTMQLVHEETTLAEALQEEGYSTAHIGKWHLGDEPYFPEHQGFDVNIAGCASGGPPGGYFLPNNLDLPDAEEGEYLTDRLAIRAEELIRDWADRPFFIYFPFYTVHTPIQGRQDLTEYYEERIESGMYHTNPTYAAMHHSLDQAVGRVLDTLEELDIDNETIILFSSDNGGLSWKNGNATGITDNAPLRRGKGSAYEGGTRVPLIVRWPGVAPEGSLCDEPASTVDFYDTILEMTGAEGDANHNETVDGVSLVPVLREPIHTSLDRDAIYWHFPHYHPGGDSPYSAVRSGDWKLIEFHEDDRVELYNLREDISEENDLAAQMPERAEPLREQLHAWRNDVGAQMPLPNPNYRESE